MSTIFKIINGALIIALIIIAIPVEADVAISKYDYTINYYKDSISKENLIETIRGKDIYDKEIIVDTTYKIPDGYDYLGKKLLFNIKESNNEVNVVYSKKRSLSYCVNYFYDGIIAINNTDCFYGQPLGKEITSFVDKPKEGYVFDSFDSITVLDIEENIMNVYYKSINSNLDINNINYTIPTKNYIQYNDIFDWLINIFKRFVKNMY